MTKIKLILHDPPIEIPNQLHATEVAILNHCRDSFTPQRRRAFLPVYPGQFPRLLQVTGSALALQRICTVRAPTAKRPLRSSRTKCLVGLGAVLGSEMSRPIP